MKLDDFGRNVKRIRLKYLPGFSITKAAYKGLIHHTQLKKIEKGEWDLRISTLIQLAESWGVPVAEFFSPADKFAKVAEDKQPELQPPREQKYLKR